MQFSKQMIVLGFVATSLPMGAHAQNQTLGQPTQIADVLTFSGGVDIKRHDNLFLLDKGNNPTFQNVESDRGDTVLSGRLGVKFDRDVSLQRFTISGDILPTKYTSHSRFDHIGYNANANWDWAVGRPWFGKLGVTLSQGLSSFDDTQTGKNLEKRSKLYFNAGMRLTPSWALIAGFDSTLLDNSRASNESSDLETNAVEFGARFAPGTGTEIALVGRNTDGKYPNDQTRDAFGNVISGVNNDYSQNDLLARVQYKPNEDALISGQIGLTQRSFETDSDRDFSGPTARLVLEWRPGGRFFMGVDLSRALSDDDIATSNYVEVTTLRLRPTMRLTGKTSVNGVLAYQDRNYSGDPNSSGVTRKDKVLTFGLNADWQYSRRIKFTASLSRADRTSNRPNTDYVNNVFGVGAQVTF